MVKGRLHLLSIERVPQATSSARKDALGDASSRLREEHTGAQGSMM
jgi:hypothetical protein